MNSSPFLTSRLTPSLCPGCGAFLDAATSTLAPARPEPKDFTICINCARVLIWDENMQLRLASEADIDKLHDEQRQALNNTRMAIYMMKHSGHA
jgi:hypothetical protein